MERNNPAKVFVEATILRHGSRFPVFYLLLPQIAAFVFCGNAAWCASIAPSRWLLAGTVFAAIAAAALLRERSRAKKEDDCGAVFSGIWKTAFPLSAFFFFCFWWQFRAPPLAEWTDKAPRDAELVLRVERAYSGNEKNFGGFARVESVGEKYFAPLAGARVWYSLPKKTYPQNSDFPAEGMRLRGNGVLSGLGKLEDDSGENGFRDFLRRERASAIFSRVENPEILPGGEGFLTQSFSAINAYLRAALARISSAEKSGGGLSRAGRTFGAMMLGDKSLLLPEQKENFLLTGTIHIFAVSGLHVSILGLGLSALLAALRLPAMPAAAATLFALWVFVGVVGAPPSAMRAWLMLAFLFAGCFLGRGRLSFHGLLFAALVSLTLNPTLTGHVGFQLSYLVVAAILLYGIPLSSRLERAALARSWIPEEARTFPQRLVRRVLRGLLGGFGISFAAFLAGAPIVAATFGLCSFVSLPANVLLIPFVALAAWSGAAALVLTCVPFAGTFLGTCAFWIASIPLTIVDRGTEFLSKISFAFAEIAFPWRGLGSAGGVLMLLAFFLGETYPPLRERAWLRFGLPPVVLAVFLLIFSF